MKDERKVTGTGATISGDRLIANGRRCTFDKNGVQMHNEILIRLVLMLLFFLLLLSFFVLTRVYQFLMEIFNNYWTRLSKIS